MSTKKKITVKCSDGKTVDVDEAVALKFNYIKAAIENKGNLLVGETILIEEVHSGIFSEMVTYWEKHLENPVDDELKKWDSEFAEINAVILHLIGQAAQYLACQDLLDFVTRETGNLLKEKTCIEIRKTFLPDEEEVEVSS